jgi:sacsin
MPVKCINKQFYHMYVHHYHQGPALYASNNAVFQKEDWTGIRLLQDSIKKSNPMKVGRFGLGFKSVFHLTGTEISHKV